ncbi:hypothetical protein QP157_17270 [Sphingomonas sp. LR61]
MTTTALPTIRPFPGSDPVADPAAVVTGEHWRITVLDAGTFRIEWSDDGGFEDRASTFAIRRRLPVPAFTVERVGEGDDRVGAGGAVAGGVVVTTERARLRYDGRPFSPSGLVVETIGPDANRWRWGQEPRDLGGTGRTLDDVDGRMPLETRHPGPRRDHRAGRQRVVPVRGRRLDRHARARSPRRHGVRPRPRLHGSPPRLPPGVRRPHAPAPVGPRQLVEPLPPVQRHLVPGARGPVRRGTPAVLGRGHRHGLAPRRLRPAAVR